MRQWGVSKRRIEVTLHTLFHRKDGKEWLGETGMFLGTGMGRSGTRFLSRLLDRASDARVVHEPVDEDFAAFRHGYCSAGRRRRYIKQFRLPEIHQRLGDDPPSVYGEVNSHLRRHVSAIRKVVPEVRVFQLVRDGREVVRSMYARDTMKLEDRATWGIRPCEGDPFRERWSELSRFGRLCWYWSSANRLVRTHSEWTVRLEDIVGDYETFRADVLAPLGLELEKSVWKAEVDSPKNVTPSHDLAAPEDWRSDRKETFWDICGDEMREYGYE